MENSENHTPVAGLWRRFAAIIYDSTLVIAIWMIVGFLVLSAFGINEAQTLEGETVVLDPLYKNVLFLSMLLSAFAFFCWFWTHSGQTLGMQAWKIKVQNQDGSAISIKQSLIRFAIAPFSFACLGLGYFVMLIDKDQRTFHDKISNSVIVKVKR
jgi:uncharacterized RDD family membrane protein YckC